MLGRLLVALVSATLRTKMAGLGIVHAVFHQRIAHLQSPLSYAEIGIHHVQTLVSLHFNLAYGANMFQNCLDADMLLLYCMTYFMAISINFVHMDVSVEPLMEIM